MIGRCSHAPFCKSLAPCQITLYSLSDVLCAANLEPLRDLPCQTQILHFDRCEFSSLFSDASELNKSTPFSVLRIIHMLRVQNGYPKMEPQQMEPWPKHGVCWLNFDSWPYCVSSFLTSPGIHPANSHLEALPAGSLGTWGQRLSRRGSWPQSDWTWIPTEVFSDVHQLGWRAQAYFS